MTGFPVVNQVISFVRLADQDRIILEAVRKGNARVLVGPDAKIIDVIVRITGSGAYQGLFAAIAGRVLPKL